MRNDGHANIYERLATDENHRTEALADLLERLLSKDHKENTTRFRDFVSRVLLGKPTDEGRKIRFLETLRDIPSDALSIKTQHRTPQGIPDIVVFNGDHPILVVEVKVDAPIRHGQLEDYGVFLKSKAAHGNPTALVLLTSVTQPPEGFTDPEYDKRYSVSLRSVAFWNKVSGWFQQIQHEENGVDEPLNTLAREFNEFLKEVNMPTLDDFVIAQDYFARSRGALIQAVKKMQAASRFPNQWKSSRLGYRPFGISVWHSPMDEEKRNVQYGICFNPLDEGDEHLHGIQRYENDALKEPKPIEDGFYAYVTVNGSPDECQKIPVYSDNQWHEKNPVLVEKQLLVDSRGWYYYRGSAWAGYAKIRPIKEFLDDDGHVGNGLQEWTQGVLEDACQLWQVLFGGNSLLVNPSEPRR